METLNLSDRKSFSPKTKILIGISMGVIFSLGFYGLDYLNRTRYEEGKFVRDLWHFYYEVPIVAEWVWIYFLYFPLCFFPLLLRKVREDSEFFTGMAIGFWIQFLIAFAFFLFFPTRMIPPSFSVDSISAETLAWLRQVDKGFNAFPSLHVSNIFFVTAVIGKAKGRLWRIFFSFITIIISLSTMFTGQHCFPDVLAGMVLGILSFKISFSEAVKRLFSTGSLSSIISLLKNLRNVPAIAIKEKINISRSSEKECPHPRVPLPPPFKNGERGEVGSKSIP